MQETQEQPMEEEYESDEEETEIVLDGDVNAKPVRHQHVDVHRGTNKFIRATKSGAAPLASVPPVIAAEENKAEATSTPDHGLQEQKAAASSSAMTNEKEVDTTDLYQSDEEYTAEGGHSYPTIYDIDLDGLAEKPWRDAGADITDWFNYGFTEESWRAYCARQIQMRLQRTMKTKISVYESNVDTRDLPPELSRSSHYSHRRSSYDRHGRQADYSRKPFAERARHRGHDDAVIDVTHGLKRESDDFGVPMNSRNSRELDYTNSHSSRSDRERSKPREKTRERSKTQDVRDSVTHASSSSSKRRQSKDTSHRSSTKDRDKNPDHRRKESRNKEAQDHSGGSHTSRTSARARDGTVIKRERTDNRGRSEKKRSRSSKDEYSSRDDRSSRSGRSRDERSRGSRDERDTTKNDRSSRDDKDAGSSKRQRT